MRGFVPTCDILNLRVFYLVIPLSCCVFINSKIIKHFIKRSVCNIIFGIHIIILSLKIIVTQMVFQLSRLVLVLFLNYYQSCLSIIQSNRWPDRSDFWDKKLHYFNMGFQSHIRNNGMTVSHVIAINIEYVLHRVDTKSTPC